MKMIPFAINAFKLWNTADNTSINGSHHPVPPSVFGAVSSCSQDQFSSSPYRTFN